MAVTSAAASAAMGVRTRRTVSSSSYVSGFYRALNEVQMSSTSTSTTATLKLSSSDDPLPNDCFLVERVITVRKHKVCIRI